MAYGLKQVVMHDSLVVRKTVSIPTDGHLNIGGGNGKGKTSTLNMVPTFWGEEPNKLVNTAGDKDNFLDFYLPRRGSALIFEYTRVDGPHCVIMYRHSSLQKIIYRFVKAGYEAVFRDPSIQSMMVSGHAFSDILATLNANGVEVSRQIDTVKEYRAILQNDKKLLREQGRGSNAAVLARTYCIGGPDSHMSSMGRVTYSILKRKDHFDRLHEVISDTQFADFHINEPPQTINDRALLSNIAMLNEFESQKANIEVCISKNHERKTILEHRNRHAAAAKRHTLEAQDRVVEIKESVSQVISERAELKAGYETSTRELGGQKALTVGQLETTNSRLDTLFDDKQTWEDQDIEGKKHDYSRLPDFREASEGARRDHEMVVAGSEEIENDRRNAKQDAEREEQSRQSRITTEIEALNKELNQTNESFEPKFESLQQRFDERKQAVREGPLFTRQQDLKAEADQCRALAGAKSYSPEDTAKINALREEISQKEERRLELRELVSELERIFSETKASLEMAERSRKSAADNQVKAKNEHDQIFKFAHPEDGSLLSVLRQENADWIEDIGRVISPELLGRKDLNPDFIADTTSFYGLQIDLNRIDAPDFAENESSLRARLELSETKLNQCERELVKANNAYDEANQNCQKAKLKLQPRETDLKVIEGQIEHQNRTLQSTLHQADLNIDERCRQQQFESERLLVEANKVKDQIDSEVKKLDFACHEERQALKGERSSVTSDIKSRIKLAEDRRRTLKASHKARIEQINSIFDEKLTADGVDPKRVSAAREALEEARKKVQTVESCLDAIREYDNWVQHEWSHREEWQSDVSRLTTEIGQFESELSRLASEYDSKDTVLKNRLTKLESERRELAGMIEEARKLLSDSSLDAIQSISASEIKESFNNVISFLRESIIEEKKLRRTVLQHIKIARTIIERNPSTQVYDAWELLLEDRKKRVGLDLSDADEEFLLGQIDDLEILMNESIPNLRQALLEQVRRESDLLDKYHGSLKQLNDEVRLVSRILGERINTEQRIPDISDIKLEVKSKVEEGDYWKPLNNFHHKWREWIESGEYDLPPDSVMQAMSEASNAVRSAKIKQDILSLTTLKISFIENGRPTVINSTRDLDNCSSNGLSFIALLVLFMGLARDLCPDPEVQIHWPIDELAALSPENVERLFQMFDDHGIVCFSAFPSSDHNLLQHFEHRYEIDRQKGIRKFRGERQASTSEAAERFLAGLKPEVNSTMSEGTQYGS